MSIRFRPLLSVACAHAYHGDGPCPDFAFPLPADTAARLEGGRLLARVRDGVLHLFCETGADGQPLAALPEAPLLFGLRPLDPGFAHCTAPVPLAPGLLPLYANATLPGVLDAPRGVVLAAGIQGHLPQAAGRPVGLRLLDAAGRELARLTVSGSGAAGAFDLRALPPGPYTVEETPPDGPASSTGWWYAPGLDAAHPWGLLALKPDAGFLQAPPAFTLPFAARQDILRYYVIAPAYGQAEFDQLGVNDAGFEEEARPEILFDRVLPPDFGADDLAPGLLAPGPARTVLFRSRAPVARRLGGPRKIQLRRNGEVLIEHLPQPGTQRAQGRHIIHLSKP